MWMNFDSHSYPPRYSGCNFDSSAMWTLAGKIYVDSPWGQNLDKSDK